MLRGLKGREVIDPPQVVHCQSPVNFGFSPWVTGMVSMPAKGSSSIGSLARPASSGMSSGTSGAVTVSGVEWAVLLFCLLQQARQVSPVSLLG